MSLTRDQRVRFGAAAMLAGMFAAGVAVGFAVDPDAPAAADPSETARTGDRGGPPPNDWIIDRLDLTPEQRTRVDSVLAEYGRQMSDLQRVYRPQFRQMMDSADRSLRELLTDEQRARYDSIEAAAEGRRDRGTSPNDR